MKLSSNKQNFSMGSEIDIETFQYKKEVSQELKSSQIFESLKPFVDTFQILAEKCIYCI